MRPLILGICAAFFFASTFVLNRVMEVSGGSWIWSASLRYYFMIPFLLILVISRKNLRPLLQEMRKHPWTWLLWSFVGFGLFYAPLCFASAYSPGWLTAGTWQMTIISGTLLAPFFYESIQTADGLIKIRRKIPYKGLSMSAVILAGVALMQYEHASVLASKEIWLGILPVAAASIAYPLGNRKMMEHCEGRLDVYQRVLGMAIASLPLWFILSIYGLLTVGLPRPPQIAQSFFVAVCSGVIATVLFFRATDMVRGSMPKLAAVEATQSAEVLFAAAGEMWLLRSPVPSVSACAGMLLVITGMVLHRYVSHPK
ncbi:DMT family transporter [Paenibacillus harenae]|uniref:DMT family transporter n=1 Tax=Paenibacillus harenae TaxID=306543 RepID=UPI0004114FC6|nr:multidrug resistance efflux transporter family protein [Paenibacillus harenae]